MLFSMSCSHSHKYLLGLKIVYLKKRIYNSLLCVFFIFLQALIKNSVYNLVPLICIIRDNLSNVQSKSHYLPPVYVRMVGKVHWNEISHARPPLSKFDLCFSSVEAYYIRNKLWHCELLWQRIR